MRTWRFERVTDGGIDGFDIYCDDIPFAYASTEPAFEDEDLATLQFIVDACNAAEQPNGEMCDCPTPTAYGCAKVTMDAEWPSEAGKAVLLQPDGSGHYVIVKGGKIVRYERPRPGEAVELAPGESLAPHPEIS